MMTDLNGGDLKTGSSLKIQYTTSRISHPTSATTSSRDARRRQRHKGTPCGLVEAPRPNVQHEQLSIGCATEERETPDTAEINNSEGQTKEFRRQSRRLEEVFFEGKRRYRLILNHRNE
uniref:Uncharacterized protein n=1 Tax=Glossina palpalis gambiensis TaxID=67801 RepID=A0A1B0BVF8_9MUSC